MAEHFDVGYCTLDTVDITSQITSGTLTLNTARIGTTNWGSAGFEEGLPGLKSATLSLTFGNLNPDEAVAASVSKLMYDGSTWSSGDGIYALVVQAVLDGEVAGTESTTSPKYTFNATADGWTPVGGDPSGVVGGGMSVTFQSTGTVTRDVTP